MRENILLPLVITKVAAKEIKLYVENIAKQIGMLLFFENLVFGLFLLVVGILLGFLVSKGLLALLIQLVGLELVPSFTLSAAWRYLGILTTLLIIVLLVVLGTYLLFNSVSVFILTN